MRSNVGACLAVLGLALGGCAIDGGDLAAFRDGWREAEVVHIAGPGDVVRRPYRDCRATHAPTQQQRVVVLSYHLMRSHTLVMSVPVALDLQEGAIVYVRDSTCELQLRGSSAFHPGE